MGELRKVQQTPTGTFFVCVPRAWAQQNGLSECGCEQVTANSQLILNTMLSSNLKLLR